MIVIFVEFIDQLIDYPINRASLKFISLSKQILSYVHLVAVGFRAHWNVHDGMRLRNALLVVSFQMRLVLRTGWARDSRPVLSTVILLYEGRFITCPSVE